MELRHIAFGSLRRRRGKAALITLGLTAAVGAFVLVVSLILSLRATMDDTLSRYGSNLVVMPASSELNLSYGGMSIAGAGSGEVRVLHAADLEALRTLPSADQIVAALPIMLEPVEIDGRPFLAMGTDLAESAKVKLWWKVEGALPTRADQVMIGLNVRNELGLEPGDRITVAGRTYTVTGVLWETGGEEDNLVMMDRAALEALAGRRDEINLIEVTAADTQVVDALAREIETAVPGATVVSVKKSIEFTNRSNASLANFGLAITLLIVVISGLVVMITMLSAVKERQKEIGIFRAVGYKQKHVAQLVFIEAALLSGSAAVLGVLGGLGGAVLAPAVVQELELSFTFSPVVVVAGVVLAFVIGGAAALYPAWRAANLDPATALKYV
ncbi:MAG: ABC transporter permease [Thermoleophilia bacterium]